MPRPPISKNVMCVFATQSLPIDASSDIYTEQTPAARGFTQGRSSRRRNNSLRRQPVCLAPLDQRLLWLALTNCSEKKRSFYTTEEQIHELFSKCGEIKRLVMGLDRFNKTPCGFCFVEYYTHEDTLDAMKYIGGTKLDERIVRTDLDPGFKEGRQYGRGNLYYYSLVTAMKTFAFATI